MHSRGRTRAEVAVQGQFRNATKLNSYIADQFTFVALP